MSIKDLKDMGILLPEEKWGGLDLHTSVNKFHLVASGLIALAAVVMGYVGNGGTLTWVGVGMFFVFVAYFTWVSLKAIDVQNDETEAFLKGD